MSQRQYLVGFDRSEASEAALRQAVTAAAECGASVTVAHAVVPDIETVGEERMVEDLSEAETRAEEVLEHAATVAAEADAGVDVTSTTLYGDPAEALADYAATEDVDVVFVGHRGLSPRQETLLGSVAKKTVELVSVPVTVV